MKKIFILPILLSPCLASAKISIYYDVNGMCDSFCSIPYVGEGCCPSANELDVAELREKMVEELKMRDQEFNGFITSDGTPIFNVNGDFVLDVETARTKNMGATGGKIHTNAADSKCISTTSKNENGVCVQESASENDQPVTYVPTNTDQNGDQQYLTRGENVLYTFRLQFNGCYNGYCPDGTVTGVSNMLYCRGEGGGGREITRCYSDQGYQNPINTISVPTESSDQWEFRGYYYGRNDGVSMKFYDWGLVSACSGGTMDNQSTCENNHGFWAHIRTINNGTTTTEVYACLGIPESICRNTFNGVSTNQHVGWHEICSTRTNTDPYCVKLKAEADTSTGSPLDRFFPRGAQRDIIWVNQTDEYGNNRPIRLICVGNGCDNQNPIINVYGAWARKCAPGANATCDLEIGSLWTNSAAGFQKGDVRYGTECDQGYSLKIGGTYNPQCSEIGTGGGDAKINLVFKGLSSETCYLKISGRAWGCSPDEDDTITLPGQNDVTCAPDYAIAGWTIENAGTDNKNYELGASVDCTNTALGPDGDGNANIVGRICDCSKPDGKCQSVCNGEQGSGDDGDNLNLEPAFTVGEDLTGAQ